MEALTYRVKDAPPQKQFQNFTRRDGDPSQMCRLEQILSAASIRVFLHTYSKRFLAQLSCARESMSWLAGCDSGNKVEHRNGTTFYKKTGLAVPMPAYVSVVTRWR